MAASRVNRAAEVVAGSLSVHGHLVVVGADWRAKAVLLVAGASRGEEVDDERPYVEDVDQRDDPFEDGGFVDFAAALQDAEGDGEAGLDEDESELDPEAGAQNAVLAEVDAEALVFGADEDRGDDVSCNEDGKHCLVDIREASGVEDGQENQAKTTDDGETSGEAGEDLLRDVVVFGQATLVSQPALQEEGQVEQDDHRRAPCDEQGFAPSSGAYR